MRSRGRGTGASRAGYGPRGPLGRPPRPCGSGPLPIRGGGGGAGGMSASLRRLQIAGNTLELGNQPLLMGIVNATPDSFSDGASRRSVDDLVELARGLIAAGAGII